MSGCKQLFTCAVLTLVLPSLLAGTAASQGTLQNLRSDVRRPSKATEQKKLHLGDQRQDDEEDEWSGLGDLLGMAMWGGLIAPFVGPPYVLGDDYSMLGYFPQYPYVDVGDGEGFMMIEPWIPAEPHLWSLRLRGEYADDFDDLSRISGHLLFETTARFGIDSSSSYLRESLGNGRHDDLWTGDANLVFRLAQSANFQIRSGIGVNWLADEVGSDFGFNFTYSSDWFPRRPWILSSEIDLGRLGSASLFHIRATAGVQLRCTEFFGGYDYYDVGETPIGGFVSGLRFWF